MRDLKTNAALSLARAASPHQYIPLLLAVAHRAGYTRNVALRMPLLAVTTSHSRQTTTALPRLQWGRVPNRETTRPMSLLVRCLAIIPAWSARGWPLLTPSPHHPIHRPRHKFSGGGDEICRIYCATMDATICAAKCPGLLHRQGNSPIQIQCEVASIGLVDPSQVRSNHPMRRSAVPAWLYVVRKSD